MNERSTDSTRVIKGVIGFVMLSISTPCVLGMIADLVTKGDNIQGALIVGGFMTFIAIAGITLIASALKRKQFEVHRDLEAEVLALAKNNGGRLTVSELALGTQLNIDESEKALAYFEKRDIARTHIAESGDLVYVFPHFDGGLDKRGALDPLAYEESFEFESAEEPIAATEPHPHQN